VLPQICGAERFARFVRSPNLPGQVEIKKKSNLENGGI
jgi:hypothetical protein